MSSHFQGTHVDEIVFCHNESEENIDVLWSDGDLPRFSRLSASLKRLFFLSFFVIKADGVKVFACTPHEMFYETLWVPGTYRCDEETGQNVWHEAKTLEGD